MFAITKIPFGDTYLLELRNHSTGEYVIVFLELGACRSLRWGLKTNGCPLATLTHIFVFALLPEQAQNFVRAASPRPASFVKFASLLYSPKQKCPGNAGDIHLSCGEGGN